MIFLFSWSKLSWCRFVVDNKLHSRPSPPIVVDMCDHGPPSRARGPVISVVSAPPWRLALLVSASGWLPKMR